MPVSTRNVCEQRLRISQVDQTPRILDRQPGTDRQLIKWGLFAIIAAFLAWRIIVLGMAEHYARQGSPDAVSTALIWHPSHPQALWTQGQLLALRPQGRPLAQAELKEAKALLQKAARQNPTNGRIYGLLARLAEQDGELEKAQALMNIASYLAPMRSAVQLDAGAFWLRRGQLEQAVAHWSRALELHPPYGEDLYPLLLRLVEYPQTQVALAGLLHEPPRWWSGFFRYASRTENLDHLRILYGLGRPQGRKPSDEERRLYLSRLQAEGHWLEAYFAWLNSLDNQQLKELGHIYNGNFELPLNDQDFAWRTPKIRGVVVEVVPAYGARGDHALRITFQGQQVRFQHLYQHLLLQPGRYQLSGLLRLDNLKAVKGVQWTLNCKTGDNQRLGSSERFLGTAEWQRFTTHFTVPAEGCRAQDLRLELIGHIAQDFQAEGLVWFDDLAIVRLD